MEKEVIDSLKDIITKYDTSVGQLASEHLVDHINKLLKKGRESSSFSISGFKKGESVGTWDVVDKAKMALRAVGEEIPNRPKTSGDLLTKENQEFASELNQIEILDLKDRIIEIYANRALAIRKILLLGIILIGYIVLIACTWKFGFDIMEPILALLAPLNLIIAYSYLAVIGESFNPVNYFKKIKKEKMIELAAKENFDLEKYELLKIKIDELNKAPNNVQNGK